MNGLVPTTKQKTIDELEKSISALKIRGTELSQQKVEKIIASIEQAIAAISNT